MIVTNINGRWLLEITEEQVARAHALAQADALAATRRAETTGRPQNVLGIAGILHLALHPGLYELETKMKYLTSGIVPSLPSTVPALGAPGELVEVKAGSENPDPVAA